MKQTTTDKTSVVSRCVTCRSTDFIHRTGKQKFPFNDGERVLQVTIDNVSWDECTGCGELYLDHKARAVIERAQANAAELLSPEELRRIRKAIGTTHSGMAKLLGVGEKSYIRWENGQSIQTRAIDNLIRLTTSKILATPMATAARAPQYEEIQQRFPMVPAGALELYKRMMTGFAGDCFPLAMGLQEAH